MWQDDEGASRPDDAGQLRGSAEPDSFVIGGRYRAWDERGNLKLTLSSDRIDQFEDTAEATMEAPRARVYSDDDPAPWIISADTGRLRLNNNQLFLSGDVRVTRQPASGGLTLETSELTLDNEQATVFTDQPVTITEAFGVTRATGMKAWADERILELNSRVEGHYETVR